MTTLQTIIEYVILGLLSVGFVAGLIAAFKGPKHGAKSSDVPAFMPGLDDPHHLPGHSHSHGDTSAGCDLGHSGDSGGHGGDSGSSHH